MTIRRTSWSFQLVVKVCYLQGARQEEEDLRRRDVLDFQGSPSSLGGITHRSCLSTDEWVFLFATILVDQVFVGAMGNTPPIWVEGVGDISDVSTLSCWILCFTFWDRVFTILSRTHTMTTVRASGDWNGGFLCPATSETRPTRHVGIRWSVRCIKTCSHPTSIPSTRQVLFICLHLTLPRIPGDTDTIIFTVCETSHRLVIASVHGTDDSLPTVRTVTPRIYLPNPTTMKPSSQLLCSNRRGWLCGSTSEKNGGHSLFQSPSTYNKCYSTFPE